MVLIKQIFFSPRIPLIRLKGTNFVRVETNENYSFQTNSVLTDDDTNIFLTMSQTIFFQFM